jgi:hypothetical protein
VPMTHNVGSWPPLVRLFPEPSMVYIECMYLMEIASLAGMEDTTFLSRFLPDAIALQLDAWELDHTATLLTLHVTSAPRSRRWSSVGLGAGTRRGQQ